MPVYPSIWRACKAVQFAERRTGPASVEMRRAAVAARPAPVGDVGEGMTVTEYDVPVDGATIAIRVHGARGGGRRPAHLIFHSGAFCYGGAQELDDLAAFYARGVGCVVLAVDYRLAPEHPFPTAVEDGYAALQWTVDNAASLDVDPGRMSIGGVSAGGCVAAAVAMMARDRGGPDLVFQLLEIPVTDLTLSSRSADRFGRGYLLTRAELVASYASYVPDPARRTEPYASPLLAPDLSGLPPAMVITAGSDPLRDEGESYARRLAQAGVPTQAVRARGHVHSSTYSAMPSARRYRRQAADALARAYAAAERA